MYKVRPYKKGDEIAISGLASITMDISYENLYLPETIDGLKQYHNEENIIIDINKGAFIVIIEDKNEIIGTGTLYGTYVKRVFIHPLYQRKGIGTLIMDSIEDEARGREMPFLELFATLPSEKFYVKLGHSTVSLYYNPIKCDQLEYYRMIKSFSEHTATHNLHNKRFKIRHSQLENPGFLESLNTEMTIYSLDNYFYVLCKTADDVFAEIIGTINNDEITVTAHYVEFNKNWKSLRFMLHINKNEEGRFILQSNLPSSLFFIEQD